MDNGRKKEYVNMRDFLDYEAVRSNIVYNLINTERNRELLIDMPHMDFFDMSVVFRCLLEQGKFCSKCFYIYNVHMKLWGVSIEELYEIAEVNTQRIEGSEIKNMMEIIGDIEEEENPEEFNRDSYMSKFSDNVPMYVLSNKNWIEGASCMLYPNLLRDFADRIGSSFYIIPSSIHELIIIPTENLADRKMIEEMLKECNDTQINQEEILSYSLFWYSRENEKMSIL